MIETTLIGHASLLIQSKETTILTDPVWFDYLWEEVNVLCPSIELDTNKIPPVDVLNISHRHQDHFDVRTLAFLAQNKSILKPDVTILAPKDDILNDVLQELGFENIRTVADFEPIKIKDITLTPTPSLNEGDYFPEHGLLVHDGEVTVWNQVDTVVNPDIIAYIHKLYGEVAFVHARFCPLLEGNFSYHQALALPSEEYSSFLKVMEALKPKFIVPGSAAFRYRDELGFLNRYCFPTTQDQYLRDLADFCPGIPSSPFYSGDIAHISQEGVHIEQQASDFVRIREDDSHRILFKPVMEVPPVRSRTTDSGQHEKEMQAIRDYIENKFLDVMLSCEKLAGWKHWRTMYQLEVFGPNGTSESWHIDFKLEEPTIQKGESPKINLYEGIAASELYGLIEGTASWDYVGLCGNYRTFGNIYRVGTGAIEFWAPERKFPQPLMQAFPAGREMDREKFRKDIRRWKGKALG